MLTRWMEQVADQQFVKDGDRVVFLPRGRKRRGFVLAAKGDEIRLRSLIVLYRTATVAFNFTGYVASYALASYLASLEGKGVPRPPLSHQLSVGLTTYLIGFALFWGGPSWLLWRSYLKATEAFTTGLTPVEPAAIAALPRPRRSSALVWALFAAGVVILTAGVVIALMARPRSPY